MAAEMRFEHEFVVEVPLQQAWRVLADADALAAALPDAQLRAVNGIHSGRVQLDPSHNLSCEATITAVDRDEDEHVATVSVHGRQVEGPGIGSAILRSRLSDQGAATAVTLTAEVLTTGHEPGNGFQTAARRMFETVAEGLECRARETATAAAAPPTPAAQGSRLQRVTPQRLAAGAAGLVITVALARRTRRGRRRRS